MTRNRRPIIGTLGANVALAVLAAGTGVIAARLLGPSGRGELAAIQTWPTFLATLTMLGLPDALVYFIARGEVPAGRYVATATSAALVSAISIFGVGWLLMPVVLAAQDAAVVAAARWYLLIVPIFALAGMPFHAFRGQANFFSWNLFRLLPPLGWLLVLGLGVFMKGPSAESLALGYLVVLALLVIPTLAVAARRIQGPFWPLRSAFGPLLRYGLPNAASGVPQVLNLRLDQMLMAGLLAREQLGLYVAAVAWSSAVAPLPAAMGSIVSPRIAAQATSEEQRATAGSYLRRAVVLSGLLSLLTALASPLGVRMFFGADFAPAVPAAVVLAVAAGFLGVNFVVEEVLRGLAVPGTILRGEMVGVAVTVISLLIFLPSLGIVGAGLASLFGYAAILVFLARKLGRELDTRPGELLRPTGEDFVSLVESARSGVSAPLARRRRKVAGRA